MTAATEADRVRLRHRSLSVIEGLVSAKDLWRKEPGSHTLPMGYFQNISLELMHGGDDWFVFATEETTPSVIWPIDVCLLVPIDRESHEDAFDFQISHVHSISPKNARGKAKLISKYMTNTVACGIDGSFHSGIKSTGGVSYISAFISGKWIETTTKTAWNQNKRGEPIPIRNYYDKHEESVRLIPALAIGVAMRHRYEWAVSIGRDDGPSVRVGVDPTAINDLFRYRDADPGKMRRSALMKWVTDHWRVTRQNAEIEAYVRKYMRGTSSFRWGDLNVSILPPEFDLELETKLIDARQQMRVDGQDRRAALQGRD